MASDAEVKGEVGFFLRAGKLKQIGRRGWTLRGIETPETVADHSYMTALLALYYGEKFKLDVGKVVGLALLHDINEVETGELVGDKFKPVKEKEKIANGSEAVGKVVSGLDAKFRKEYAALWKEENTRGTPEASIARDLNKLELAFQALNYELRGHPGERFEDMWEHARESVRDKRLKAVLSKLERSRPSATPKKKKNKKR
ncbi:MAG: HD domain-containing protein [archaeon]